MWVLPWSHWGWGEARAPGGSLRPCDSLPLSPLCPLPGGAWATPQGSPPWLQQWAPCLHHDATHGSVHGTWHMSYPGAAASACTLSDFVDVLQCWSAAFVLHYLVCSTVNMRLWRLWICDMRKCRDSGVYVLLSKCCMDSEFRTMHHLRVYCL
jgi:hypothetical protein